MRKPLIAIALLMTIVGCNAPSVEDPEIELPIEQPESPAVPVLPPEGLEIPMEEPEIDPLFCLMHPAHLINLPIDYGQSLTRLEDGTFAATSSVDTPGEAGRLIIFDESFTVLHDIELSVGGVPIASGHPVGLARRDGYPTFIGAEREFYHVDYDQMLIDGNLDNAVIRVIPDKMAIGFSRVEYAEYQGNVVLATGDGFSPDGIRLRLIDPVLLKDATSTLADGVWIRTYDVGVLQTQSYSWVDGQLYLVGNVEGVVGWRVDKIDLDTGVVTPFRRYTGDTNSELEGWSLLSNGQELYMTGDPNGQLWHGDPTPTTGCEEL